MTYQLYYFPGGASLVVHWMLRELNQPFTLTLVDQKSGALRSQEYLQLNPLGQIPTLLVDGKAVTESTAILMLLAERHPQAGLAPAPGTPERAKWLVQMVQLANGLLPAFRNWFYADKDGDPAGADGVRALARRQIEASFDRLDAQLADGRPFLLGQHVSTVDLMATMLMRWSRNMPKPATDWPHLATHISTMRSRSAYIATCDAEGLTDWRNTPA